MKHARVGAMPRWSGLANVWEMRSAMWSMVCMVIAGRIPTDGRRAAFNDFDARHDVVVHELVDVGG